MAHITSPCLRLENVSYEWPSGAKALDECSFSLPGPGLWMIVGNNGSGKSSLFRLKIFFQLFIAHFWVVAKITFSFLFALLQ